MTIRSNTSLAVKVDTTINFSVKLINLDESEDRLKTASRALKTANIAFERFSAINGRKRSDLVAEYYDDAGANKVMGRSLSHGEIGCFLSHLGCLKEFLSGPHDLLLIIEDDFAFAEGGAEAILATLDLLASGNPITKPWMVTLGRRRKKIFGSFTSFSAGGVNWNLRRAHYVPDRTTGLIWTRAAASEFISDFVLIRYPIDIELQFWCGKNRCGLVFDSAPLVSGLFESTIDNGGNSNKRNQRGKRIRRLDKFRLFKLYVYALRSFVSVFLKTRFTR